MKFSVKVYLWQEEFMSYCYGCMAKLDSEGKCPKCSFSNAEYKALPHQLPAGTILHERFMVGAVLGEGGFGITYIGMDLILEIKVAIKEFYMTGFVNRNHDVSCKICAETGENNSLFVKNREKFYQEAKTLAKFSGTEGVVTIRDFFNENDTAYIVMDYLEGTSLRAYLKEKNKLSVEETLNLVRPLFSALQAIHNDNIIHRDISPDNIMLTDDGKVLLIDFGAAREYSDKDVKSLSIILKPGYAPEEQYRSKGEQGPWTDVYALSATIYRCIAGIRPEDALERVAEDNVTPLCEIDKDCSKALSDIIMKGLAVRQKDRYQSAGEMFTALKEQVTGERKSTPEEESVKTAVAATMGAASGNVTQAVTENRTATQAFGKLHFRCISSSANSVASVVIGQIRKDVRAGQSLWIKYPIGVQEGIVLIQNGYDVNTGMVGGSYKFSAPVYINQDTYVNIYIGGGTARIEIVLPNGQRVGQNGRAPSASTGFPTGYPSGYPTGYPTGYAPGYATGPTGPTGPTGYGMPYQGYRPVSGRVCPRCGTLSAGAFCPRCGLRF